MINQRAAASKTQVACVDDVMLIWYWLTQMLAGRQAPPRVLREQAERQQAGRVRVWVFAGILIMRMLKRSDDLSLFNCPSLGGSGELLPVCSFLQTAALDFIYLFIAGVHLL